MSAMSYARGHPVSLQLVVNACPVGPARTLPLPTHLYQVSHQGSRLTMVKAVGLKYNSKRKGFIY